MDDVTGMRRAIEVAATARVVSHPNPWVGAVVTPSGEAGSTEGPGERHAEAVALSRAEGRAEGSTVFTTLEPCAPFAGKRTPSCAEALIAAGVRRVVVGTLDPDERVRGRGVALLRSAGIDVAVGICEEDVRRQLAPYIVHRTTGRPYVVLKLASSLDGRTAAPDGTSRWITGADARTDAHRLRAESDAVVVGAGTVRTDDPALDVRHVEGRNPRRIVLGQAPRDAKVHPCEELQGDLEGILDRLGSEGVVQVLVEGGATVAGAFHRAGLVDQYVLYLAPALFGGDDGPSLFAGSGASTIADVWRGRIVDVGRLGEDLRVVIEGKAA